MKLYAPKYFKNFKCIADKCEHSCCVGWEIDIDEKTLRKYEALKSSYGSSISDSICKDGTPHFRLFAGDRCPHLDENGLCKIILNEGEDYLCDICREHPRFYNYTKIAEVGLGMSCPEAARVIFSSSDYDAFEEIGEVDAREDQIAYDGRDKRAEVYEILKSHSDYGTALESIYEAFSIGPAKDEYYLEILDEIEYLDGSHKDLFMQYSSDLRPSGMDEYLKRFFAYLVYRHCTEALDDEDFCERLVFCLFLERLFASLLCIVDAKTENEIALCAVMISEEIEYSEDNTMALMC